MYQLYISMSVSCSTVQEVSLVCHRFDVCAIAGSLLTIHLRMPNMSGITPCTMSVDLQAETPQTLLVQIGAVSLCQR